MHVCGRGEFQNVIFAPESSYQDFAIALFDELERPAHSRQRFTVAY